MSCRTNRGAGNTTTKSLKFRAAGAGSLPNRLLFNSAPALPPFSHSAAAGGLGICRGHSLLLGNRLLKPQQRHWETQPLPWAFQQLPPLPAGRHLAPQSRQRHRSTMFAVVRYGANCQDMVNLHCSVLILTDHLKRKCQCRPEDCIDLVDENGTLMNLSKVEDPASEFSSKYLQERQHYILIRVVREQNSEATSYESLLEDLGKHYPDLPDQLQQLSGKTQRKDERRKSSFQRRAQPHSSTQARNRTTSQSRKSLEFKNTPK